MVQSRDHMRRVRYGAGTTGSVEGECRYPFARIEVGESFVVLPYLATDDLSRLQSNVCGVISGLRSRRVIHESLKFRTTKCSDGVLVTRTA
jgi:hypothetical protein